MTTAVEPAQAPDSATIAERLREYMGNKKISRNKLAMASGLGRSALSVKLDGQGDFTLTDIAAIAYALGRGWYWLLTGDETDDPPPPGFGLPSRDENGLLLPRLDSNQEPADVLPQIDRTAA